MSIHTIAYIQNPCRCVLLQTRFLKSWTSRGLQTKHSHITLACHTQPCQQLKYHTPYALEKNVGVLTQKNECVLKNTIPSLQESMHKHTQNPICVQNKLTTSKSSSSQFLNHIEHKPQHPKFQLLYQFYQKVMAHILYPTTYL